MKTLVVKLFRSLAIVALLLAGVAELHAQPSLLVYDFDLGMEPADNVDHVKAMGFSGLVTRVKSQADLGKLEDYASHVATLDDFRLLAYVVHDFAIPASADLWRQALPTLARLRAPLWVVVRQAPSTAAIRELLVQMARESQALGVPTVIYPHWNTSIETAAEAAVFIDDIGHPNLRNSIHTCHEIRGGNQYDMQGVVAAHAADTELVAIAGADEDAYAGPFTFTAKWDDVIKPLDEGAYSLLPFLQALHDSGYDGPVILQTFGITGSAGHLQRSIRKYGEYTEQIARSSR